jgi:hypothetical protein
MSGRVTASHKDWRRLSVEHRRTANSPSIIASMKLTIRSQLCWLGLAEFAGKKPANLFDAWRKT